MVLVDANVLLDILTYDPMWSSSSEEKLLAAIEDDQAAVNPIVFAELGCCLSHRYGTRSGVDRLADSAVAAAIRGGVSGSASFSPLPEKRRTTPIAIARLLYRSACRGDGFHPADA